MRDALGALQKKRKGNPHPHPPMPRSTYRPPEIADPEYARDADRAAAPKGDVADHISRESDIWDSSRINPASADLWFLFS